MKQINKTLLLTIYLPLCLASLINLYSLSPNSAEDGVCHPQQDLLSGSRNERDKFPGRRQGGGGRG